VTGSTRHVARGNRFRQVKAVQQFFVIGQLAQQRNDSGRIGRGRWADNKLGHILNIGLHEAEGNLIWQGAVFAMPFEDR